ncbi:LysM peptidoglycan-binding domain-containing protein [Pseudomonas sp. LRF_L74]|uniref:LysM peptidoglycan-binding domain-containing protein n=1 Tax=Pseudomonas sp. LRF_L74 TaxID=3369422 RepID=UPI003F622544
MRLQPDENLENSTPAMPLKILAAALCLGLAGCQSMSADNRENPAPSKVHAAKTQPYETVWLSEDEVTEAPSDIWDRMRSGFKLQDEIGVNPRIENQRLWFVGNPSFLEGSSERGSLYIHYVVERLEERGMPMELALLPMIESSYNPFALSRSQAMGLWQFIPATGRVYNLRQTNWYDGRRDITASTNAALTYLSRLHDMFNGDWLLALAAYNAGEGTVSRAIERNEKLGLPTDYWNLPLPKETQDYVPKLLALSQLVMSPDAYGIALSPIANEPYFEQIDIPRRLDLNRVAQLADIDAQELYNLNPAFKKRVTMDGPLQLLVPIDKAEVLAANLASMPASEALAWQEYRVRSGDSLHSIASRYKVNVNELKNANQLKGNRLSIGQALTIPGMVASTGSVPLARQVAQIAVPASSSRRYKVKNGDTLWQIANANKISVKDLLVWNKLSAQSKLSLGQELVVRQGRTQETVASASKSGRQNVTYYRVKRGDSMSLIAQRFKIEMEHLQRWNPSSSKNLKPGQTLTLYLSTN